jgi:SOS-response transcriptional repressor LexA
MALGLDPQSVRSGAPPTPIGGILDSGERRRSADFPVFYMQLGTATGEFILSAEAVDYVERPSLLASVKDAFGICVYGDLMAPAYEAGDVVFVHPYKPPIVGGDVVLRPADMDDSRVIIGRLTGETVTHWVIFQHKRGGTIKLAKAEWGRCNYIIGKYNRT